MVGPFGDDLKAAYPPENKTDPKETYAGKRVKLLNGSRARRSRRAAQPEGDLSGRQDLGVCTDLCVLAADAEGDAAAAATTRCGLAERQAGPRTATPRSARPDEDRVRVPLREGWNVVLAKVVNVDAGRGLYLRFVGEGLRVALRPGKS